MEYNPEYKRMYNRYLSAFSTNINKAREQLNSISVPNDFSKKSDIDGIKRRLKEVDVLKVQREIDIICANIEKSERDAINAKFASMDINAPSMALNPLTRNTNGKNNELNPHSLNAIFNSQQNKNGLGEQGGLWENTKAFLANSMEISYEAQQLQTQANIEMAQKTGADIINTATALFWGIISGGEKIVDAFATFGTNFIIEQTQNELRDMEEDGHKDDKFREKTEKELETLRVNTMAYVAEEKTNNYFENEIYDSTFMQNVNETAHNPFKKEAVAFELTKGVGEAIPIITAGVVSGGKAWAIAATSAVIGFGNASQENLQRAKENSIQGLEEKVKTGEMSQEEYDEIIRIHEMTSEEIDRRIETERIDINTIRAFSDEDLENIYLAGGISTEIYEQYKNIRQLTDEEINERLEETREYYNNIANISDNWQTEDVWNNTLAYSSIAALWEGAQGYVGSVLNTNPLGMSQLAASVVNVTIDSTTSFADTIVRAGARSLVEGSSFTKNFEELGGLTQAFINAGTGGTTSFIFGELPDLIGAKAEGTLFMTKAEATSFRIGKLEESLGDDAEKIIVNAVIDGDIEKLNIDKKITNKLSEDDWWNYVKEKTVKRLEFDNVDSNKIEAFQTKILEEIKAKKIDVRTIYPQSPDELLKKFEETVSDSLEDTNIRRLCNDVEFAMYTNDPELYIKSKLNIKDCSTSELMDHFFELSEKDQETALRLIANKGAVIEDENIARQVVLYNKMLNDRNTGLDISKCKYYADENGKRVASGAWGNKNVHEVYTEKYGEYVEYIKKSLDITEKEATQMLDDLIKEGSESSTVTMINDSMVSYYSFFEEHQEVLQKYLDYQKITEMYDKITLLNNEEFKEFAKKVGYGDDEYANQIMAIASEDYIRFNEKFFDSGQTETTTINHEITHKLGNLYSDRKNDRGINEAATELIATKCTHRQTITAFKDNVESLNKIADVVGEDVLYEAYFSKNYKIFQTKLDEIMGEGFYDRLKQQMFISIGGSNGVEYSIDERKLAQKTVNEMAERVTKVNSELGFEEMMNYANHKNIDATYINLANSANNKNMTVETPKIDWASKMAEANYHTRKGHSIGIHIQDVNDIPKEFFEGIEDPSSVYFVQNGKRISFVEAKLANLNITMEKPKTDWASIMAEANYNTKKGRFMGIPIQDVSDIPMEFFEGIEDPSGVYFIQNGKQISFEEARLLIDDKNVRIENLNEIHALAPFIQEYRDGKIRLQGAKIDDINDFINKRIERDGFLNDTDYKFKYCCETGGNYGCNQGVFDDMVFYRTVDGRLLKQGSSEYRRAKMDGTMIVGREATPEYFEIKEILKRKYGMTANDASQALSSLNSIGACSYAAVANDFISHWKNNPQEFEKIFGFPLYKRTEVDVYTLNDQELLADLFLFANKNETKGAFDNNKLFFQDKSGKFHINDNAITQNYDRSANVIDENMQVYLSGPYGSREDIINNYLKSKSLKIRINTKTLERPDLYPINVSNSSVNVIHNSMSTEESIKNLIQTIRGEMDRGNEVSIGIVKAKRIYHSDKNIIKDANPIRIYDAENLNSNIFQNLLICDTFDWGEGERTCFKSNRTYYARCSCKYLGKKSNNSIYRFGFYKSIYINVY